MDWTLGIAFHFPHNRLMLGWEYIAKDERYTYTTIRLYLFIATLKGKIITTKVQITEPKISKNDDIKINSRLQGIIFSRILENMPEYGKITGIKIIKMRKDSVAFAAGIRPNDVILSINNIPVQKIQDLEIVAGKNDSEIVVHVQRKNRTAFILLK